MDIAGVVILYHPDQDVIHNIITYLHDISRLYVLDNSEKENDWLLKCFASHSEVKYVPFGENKGIAYALNYALKKAQLDGYSFLLTMDQDSSFPGENIKDYFKKIEESEKISNNIVSYALNYGPLIKEKVENQIITYYITSGSVLNISRAMELGGFDENLFIDQVDSEFAYRARQNGLAIKTFFEIKLKHQLGNTKPYQIGPYKFSVLNHGALRKYYIFRNLIYVSRKYPFLRKAYYKYIMKELIKIVLFEKDRGKKFKYIYFALLDAHKRKYGKFSRIG